jgi:hypothetical protein
LISFFKSTSYFSFWLGVVALFSLSKVSWKISRPSVTFLSVRSISAAGKLERRIRRRREWLNCNQIINGLFYSVASCWTLQRYFELTPWSRHPLKWTLFYKTWTLVKPFLLGSKPILLSDLMAVHLKIFLRSVSN